MKIVKVGTFLLETIGSTLFIDWSNWSVSLYAHPKQWELWPIFGKGEIGGGSTFKQYLLFKFLFFSVWKNLKEKRGVPSWQ